MTSAQKQASKNELSFRHVVGRGAGAQYEQAMRWLRHCVDVGALQAVESAIIVHRITHGAFSATGFLAEVSLDAYDNGRIRRHETTIAKTQRKMVDYMQSTRLFGNPVALAYRDQPGLAQTLSEFSRGAADVTFEAIDGAEHSLWVIGARKAHDVLDALTDVLYITDGHHRLAAASWLAEDEGIVEATLPAAVYAERQLTVGAFARVVTDDALSPLELLQSLERRFELHEVSASVPRPPERHQIGVRLANRSFILTLTPDSLPADPYDRLDVNLLQTLVLQPFLGISDPRTDPRLRFKADTASTEHDADACTAWFMPYPTSVPDVMQAADSGRDMPPKSTYFMPKVPSGLVVRPMDASAK